ncbi:MAG: hypothetical protein GY722_26050 [bacterium]|nr:hypothetical protein [bacterium]
MNRRDDLSSLLTDPGPALDHADARVRRIAVAAARTRHELLPWLSGLLGADPDPAVRRECAEVLGLCKADVRTELETAATDEAAEVREAAVTALGELDATESLELLAGIAVAEDESKLVREAAVAALGAIGDRRAVPVLIELIAEGPPQIRRRSAAALSVFDGDHVERALRSAAADRNPMVREAAEMVVGRSAD